MTVHEKWGRLAEILRGMESAVLAYSGGVDSSLLLKAGVDALGGKFLAVTALSETYPAAELADAREFARSVGAAHLVIESDELRSEDFCKNTPERCYFCKSELFGKLASLARERGFAQVLDGSNLDDLADHRPGRRAAAEHSVRSPLIEAKFTKQDVRELARSFNLPLWDKPSLACLASRIPYGTRVTPAILSTIGKAEDVLVGMGFQQVRVRHHGDTARIEISPDDFGRISADGTAGRIASALRKLGYTYVCLDLEGYRTGSMNEGLSKAQRAESIG